MFHKVISIQTENDKEEAKLHTYFIDNSAEIDENRVRPVVLICPGGGYETTSDREAESVALKYLAAGFHAAVLRYSVAPSKYPVALLQLAESVKYLRSNANKYHIQTDKIILQGFSAGGHLAASLGVFWKKKNFIAKTLNTTPNEFKPNGLILSYPVITAKEKSHTGSFIKLLGDQYEELKESMSLEEQVDVDTPPTFLWHTATDDAVPVENSIMFFQALHKFDIPVEMHIYPVGGHGLSLATKETCIPNGYGIQKECEGWIELAIKWMNNLK